MGCTPSGSVNKDSQEGGASPEALELYLRLERDIWREEKSVPAPALNHAMVRLEAAGVDLGSSEQRLSRYTRTGATDDSLREVLLELRIDRDAAKAQEHEEFLANINRQALARNEVALLTRRQEEAEEEVKIMTAKVNYLQGLYQQQDALLGDLFGEAYGSEEEKRLELELDKLRSYRDTLAGGELEWKDAVTLVSSSTELLERALQCWNNLDKQGDAEDRLLLATEARNRLQEAALNVQAAQVLLPGVQFPYCSPRELTAVLQAVVYIFTDIQEPERKQHSHKCYHNFSERARALHRWMEETMQHTLQKDLTDVDLKVGEATASLRAERVGLIRGKISGVPAQVFRGGEPPPQISGVPAQVFQGGELPPQHGQPDYRSNEGPRRITHSALFSSPDPSQNQLYGPKVGQSDKTTPGDKIQKEFQMKLKSGRRMWSSREFENQVNTWRPGALPQQPTQEFQPMAQRLANY